MKRTFKRNEKGKYSHEEKLELAELVKKCNGEYDAEVAENKGKTKYDSKRKKHVPIMPTTGYVAKAVRTYYSDLADCSNDDPLFDKAIKLASRSYNDINNLRDPSARPPKKLRASGAGRKTKAPEVREALFSWFVDVRETLKGRLPQRLFKLKAKQLFGIWLEQNEVEEKDKLKFSNCWIKGWEREYGISLRKPNKRYSIKKSDLVERLQDYLKNIWTIGRFFIEKYGVDPPIINGDQMPLHRNESSQQKTLAFKGEDTFVKENYMLSRERVTVFTQVSNEEKIKLDPEFVFKGKGTRTKVDVPNTVKFQWSESGSYRLEHMLKTINNLPNRYNPFTPKDFAMYALDDYAVHLMPEIRKALYQRGYILVVLGGGITGFIQANDTDLHHHLKTKYRHAEMELMLKKLEVDSKKIPAPNREQMINMLLDSWKQIDVDFKSVFKKLFVTNKLDGSEDFLVSDKLFSLIGDEMLDFRRELLRSALPANLQAVVQKIIKPKGIKRKNFEGSELLDYMEGDATFYEEEPEENPEEIEPTTSDDESEEGNDMRPSDAPEMETDQSIPTGQASDAPEIATDQSIPTPNLSIRSLVNICDDPLINKDAKFLDDLQKVFQNNETSTQFKPHINKIKAGFYEARRSLKKRIVNKASETEQARLANEDDGNIFDVLNDM